MRRHRCRALSVGGWRPVSFREVVAMAAVGRGQARRIESGDGIFDRLPPLFFERVESDMQLNVLLRVE